MRRLGMLALPVAMVALGWGGCDGAGEERRERRCPEPGDRAPTAEGYQGVLVDAWTELRTPAFPGLLACAMDANDVEHAALVARQNPRDTLATEAAYRAAVAGNEGVFLPFIELPALGESAGADVERVVREVGLFFRGVAVPDFTAVPSSLMDTAGALDLFVAGPMPRETERLLPLLEAHPGTKVLVVETRPPEGLADALRTHPRLFVVVLGPTLTRVGVWRDVFAAAPERVMWGSGVARVEDAAPDAYAAVVAGVRAFTGELPTPIQADFAGGNARRLLGVPIPPEPDA